MLPKFITYQAVTDAGLTLTGMITAETATSITLRRPDSSTTTLLRVNIAELRSLGVSFMPEGFERQINVAGNGGFAELSAVGTVDSRKRRSSSRGAQ